MAPWKRAGSPGAVGFGRIRWGGIAGLAAAVAGLVLPVAYLEVVGLAPADSGLSSVPFWQVEGTLLLAGALLFALSLFLYGRAFSMLSTVSRRFELANALGWVGILGFLSLAVAAVLLTNSAGTLAGCVQGTPTRAIGCLENGPSGAVWGSYAGAVGLIGAWLGGLGLVLGLNAEGARTGRTALRWAAAIYGLLLLVLIGPILAILTVLPDGTDLLLAAPFLLMAAPSATLAGTGL